MDFPDFSDETIQFHSEAIDFDLANKDAIASWILDAIQTEKQRLAFLNFIFCNDTYLHQINLKFLNHDTLTDVITFPYGEPNAPIESDIYISIDRIKENAKNFEVSFIQELKRVMIHAVLHLCGYDDKNKEELKMMRVKENYYLEIEERK